MTTNAVQEIRRNLLDPVRLCTQLGLMQHAKRQASGVIICCPVHGEKNPSCSVTTGDDGTIRAKCFACDFAGDALGLIAVVYGTPTSGAGFKDTLREGAELAGLHWLVDELSGQGAQKRERREPTPAPEPKAPAEYPDTAEVIELWETCGSVADDTQVSGYLVGRALDPDVIAARYLARAIIETTKLPSWATFEGSPWTYTGHRLVLPVWDHLGAMRSVRVCRVTAGETPKRLPPAGRRAKGLILANHQAIGALRSKEPTPQRFLFAEGEPDFLTLAQHFTTPVFGVLTGAWSTDFAKRIPRKSEIVLWTHADQAGDRYAQSIAETLPHCAIWRRNP